MPETIIRGVVDANGPGGGKVPPEKLWSLNLSLVAWREMQGKIHNTELEIYKNVSDEELNQIQELVKPESLIQFKAKLSNNSPFGDSRAQLISVMNSPDDKELIDALNKYKVPVKINHPKLGELILNKSVDWFEGQISWLGKSIELAVSLDEGDNPNLSILTAEALCKDMDSWSKRINNYAISELLELKNDNWLGENEKEIGPTEFLQAMELNSIIVHPEGGFEFWHSDGDLFWGHSILISGSITEGPNDADIPG